MLSFNPVDFSFHSADKGYDFPAAFDELEPFNELFDQHVSQASSSSSDNVNEPIEFGLFDFPGDEDIASQGSYIADQPASNFAHPRAGRLHRSQHIAFPITRSSEPVLQRRHHRSTCFERPTAAISGIELLSLEGKLPHQTPSTHLPPYSGTPTLPLRRKPKFTPESLRSSSHRVSKTGTSNGGESPSMIRPSQYKRQDTPEWTNRFEQITLHASSTNLPLSSHISTASQDHNSRQTVPHRSSYNNQQFTINTEIDLDQSFSAPEKIVPDPVSSPIGYQATTQHGLLSAWARSPSNQEDFDFTISPKDLHGDWSQDLAKPSGSYYENPNAVQSAPALSAPESTFSNENLLMGCNPFGQFVTEDPSSDYFVTMDPFQTSANDIGQSSFPPHSARKASTPSSRSSSVCPSPSPSAKAPPKTRKRSKSTRRKSSAGALKSSKSGGALGFVNFTPSDSQKILTGVAPSGSSKTKARRELEANERKRRLSMAAEKAVRDAGGDPEKLRAAGLI